MSLEKKLLARFSERSIPFLSRHMANNWEWLFLMQHYGVPTFAIKGEDNDTYYAHINAALDAGPRLTMDDGADTVSVIHSKRCDLIPNIIAAWDYIGHYHLGDTPGRKEPTTGEINYRSIFKFLHEKGFNGVLGMEHGKSKGGKEGELALLHAYRWCDAFDTPYAI